MDGNDYYEILLVYVDNVLAYSHDSEAVMVGIAAKFDIKNDRIAEPKLYFGGKVEKFQLPNGKYAWSITSTSYVQGAIDNVQRLIVKDGSKLRTGKRPHKGPLLH